MARRYVHDPVPRSSLGRCPTRPGAIVFAGEKAQPEYAFPAPSTAEAADSAEFRLLGLEPLVRMKLTSFRRKDQVHLLDLAEVGLIDASWLGRFEPVLAARLQELLESPEY